MTTGRRLQASRYLHLFERHGRTVAFNSSTSEIFELDAAEAGYLRALSAHGAADVATQCVGLDDARLEPLLNAGLVVSGDEPHGLAIDRLAKGRRARRARPGSHFGTLRLSLTERCNMACTYCFQRQQFPEVQPTMSDETLRDTMNWYVEQGERQFLTVQYFGGEPLMQWNSIVIAHEILERAKSAGRISGFRETITTNGTLMNRERAEWLVERGFDLIFSFDGPPEVNDLQRKLKSGRGAFDLAARGLRAYVDGGGPGAILMTATPQNLSRIPHYVRWFIDQPELSISLIGINSPQPTTRGWETGGTELADAIWESWRVCLENGVDFHGPGTYIPYHLRTLRPQDDGCVDRTPLSQPGSWPMYVTADGRRSMCLVFGRGSCAEVDEARGPIEHARSWHTSSGPADDCDACIASQTCGGPCMVERLMWEGNLSSDRCGFMRRMTELVVTQG